ncbi:excalibur calcium-binding domain-containing protein [Ectopseudomonas mendocina]|uniref:Calcium-binding protein n=1 Tax=Ectopseudomonas mendocina TaxID=300 RepID=A0A2R3QRK2_ECTME|nr:excalibur calcium-binding domain-containing protein [Pseudomonas mendocina]AVO54358.1 calcium-binding protein [Pseudomonas mendocina]
MKKLIIILLLGAAFWQFYLSKPGSPVISNIASDGSVMESPVVTQSSSSSFSLDSLRSPPSINQPAAQVGSSQYRCDGRTHCSQMTSCAEATYFLRNCPGTKMDGDNDGVPCEGQWCGR